MWLAVLPLLFSRVRSNGTVWLLSCVSSPPLVWGAGQGGFFFTRDTGITPGPGSACLCGLRLRRLRWLSSQGPVAIHLGQACPVREVPFPQGQWGAWVTCGCRRSWGPEDRGHRFIRARSQAGPGRRVGCCCLRVWACPPAALR